MDYGYRENPGYSPPPSSSGAGRAEITALKKDIEKLYMITESLWAILKQKHGYTDENLAQMIKIIDAQDGNSDGKKAKSPNPECHNCGRVLMDHQSTCLYCGAENIRDPFER